MAIVTGGLGQPESGAIVAGGLGTSETNPNAMRAVLAGTSTIAANLTAGGAPTPEPEPTGGHKYRPYRYPQIILDPPKAPEPIPGVLVAHLSGTSRLSGSLDYEIDADLLAYELAAALLLDLV